MAIVEEAFVDIHAVRAQGLVAFPAVTHECAGLVGAGVFTAPIVLGALVNVLAGPVVDPQGESGITFTHRGATGSIQEALLLASLGIFRAALGP